MTTTDKRYAEPLRRIARAEKARTAAELEWRRSIVAAHQAGLSSRRIGAATDLTHTRILDIIRSHSEETT
jgi:hypothetical protein